MTSDRWSVQKGPRSDRSVIGPPDEDSLERGSHQQVDGAPSVAARRHCGQSRGFSFRAGPATPWSQSLGGRKGSFWLSGRTSVRRLCGHGHLVGEVGFASRSDRSHPEGIGGAGFQAGQNQFFAIGRDGRIGCALFTLKAPRRKNV